MSEPVKVYILHIENGNFTEIEVYSTLERAKTAPRLAAFDVDVTTAEWDENREWYWPTWYLDNGATASIQEHAVDEHGPPVSSRGAQ